MILALHTVPSARLADALIDSCWQAVALTASAALILRAVPRLSAAARAAFWMGVLVVVLALPLASLFIAHASSGPAFTVHVATRVSAVLIALWAGASAFRLVQLLASAQRLHAVLRRAVPVEPLPEALLPALQNSGRSVRLCTSAEVQKPSVAGFLRPCILLPTGLLEELSSTEVLHVVLHECEHLRRGDDWINLLQQIGLVLLPLNPALPWLNRRLSLERELACDDRVLASTQARKAYAACLAHVAEKALVQRGITLALGMLGRRPELLTRVERILRSPRPAMGPLQTRFASGLLLAGIAGGAGMLAHCPELVSFAGAPAQMAREDVPALPLPTGDVALRGAHMTLAKAVMPPRPAMTLRSDTPVALRPHVTGLRAVRPPARIRLHTVRQPRLQAQPYAVLTQWQQPAPRFTPATHVTRVFVTDAPITGTGTEVWYTAIAWRDGWLVVQL